MGVFIIPTKTAYRSMIISLTGDGLERVPRFCAAGRMAPRQHTYFGMLHVSLPAEPTCLKSAPIRHLVES